MGVRVQEHQRDERETGSENSKCKKLEGASEDYEELDLALKNVHGINMLNRMI